MDEQRGVEAAGELPEHVFDVLNGVLAGSTRVVFLAEAMRAQAMLALWDAVVADEDARGMRARQGSLAERAFAMHLAGILHVSRNRAVGMLHTAVALRGLASSWSSFVGGAFPWVAAESVVRNSGSLTGDARDAYDNGAAALAVEVAPQLLDSRLSRLHDLLDERASTETAAAAHRERGLRARPLGQGLAQLTLTGPETDIAAAYETAHRAAVAAHGIDGEDRTVGQLMFDATLDVLAAGFACPPASSRDEDGTVRPSTPFERLGDPRVPHRKAITAEILVMVPATTVCGASDAAGRIAGWGSLAAAEARRLVASARFWTRVEVDPVDDAILAFDSHTRAVPAALRRLIHLRSDTCDEIGCPTGAHRCDLDHVIRVEHGGRTSEINLSALCRPGRQTKDDGYLDVHRTPDGTLTWHTRWGGRFQKPPATRIRPPADSSGGEPPPWADAA